MARLLCMIFITFCINGFAQQADFSFKTGNNSFCSPVTVDFNQQCTGQPIGFIWQSGSEKSYEENPSFIYKSAGTYTVTLTAVYDKSTSKISKTIIVNAAVTASVTATKNQLCQPGSVSFNAVTSVNVESCQWDFGDGTAPVITSVPTINHHFANFGTYTVTMTATSAAGCSKAATTVIKIAPPEITTTSSIKSGCIPATVRFTANVKLPAGSTVASYTWDFDDGTAPVVSKTGTVNKVYNKVGDFFPKLTVVTTEGCSATYNYAEHSFGTPPVNLVTHPIQSTFCGSETAGLYAEAADADNYRWEFGDGSSLTDTLNLVKHRYKVLGKQTVQVTPFFNGCAGTPGTFTVDVIGVIASFKYSNTCADRKTYDFVNTSLGNISSVAWTLGGGLPRKTSFNLAQTYPSSGQYRTELTIADNISGCTDKEYVNIYTADPILINADLAVCKDQFTTFTIDRTYTNPKTIYNWNVLGKSAGPADTAALTIKADALGFFSNSVVINSGTESCPDTVSLDHGILVRGPLLDISQPTAICLKSPFIIVNNSRPYIAADSIATSFWNFGDNKGIDSVYQPQPYHYKKSGKYKATYMATDINGCRDSVVQQVVVNRLPFVNVIATQDTFCLGQDKTYIAFHSDSISWRPSDILSCTACDTVIATPKTTTTAYITATNQLNCSASDSVLMKVYLPFNASSLVNGYYICEKESVQLDILPASLKVSWAPATGLTNPTVYKPFASPLKSTRYQATLTDSVGCFSSAASVDVVVNPLPRVDAGGDADYSYMANFMFAPSYTGNIKSYLWSPATHLNCATCAVPKGVVAETLTYYVSVVSDSGCVASDSVTIGVKCSAENLLMPGAFTPNNDNLNDYYYPITRGVKKVIRFAIYNRFGQLVHEAKNFAPNNRQYGWNGKYRGLDQPASTYMYVLDAICDLGGGLHKQGSLLLLR